MAERESGIVKWYNPVKGYGFIARDEGGADLFVHATALPQQESGRAIVLREGDKVTFVVGEGPKGPLALEVQLASAPADTANAADALADTLSSL